MNTLPDKAMVGIMKVVDCHFALKFRLDPFIDLKPSLIANLLPCINKGFIALHEHISNHNNHHQSEKILNQENNSLTIHYLF